MASTVKPGTKHPSKPGLVMGTNSRYVSKSTYAKQKVAGAKPPSKPNKPAPKVTAAKTTPTKSSPSSTTKVGATKRLQGRMVRWNGTRWTAAGTGAKQPAPTPRKAGATPKPPQGKFTAPKIPKSTPTPKPVNTSTPVKRLANAAKTASKTVAKNAPRLARAGISKAAQLLTGDGSGQLALHAVTASNLIDAARGSTAAERNANKPKAESKTSPTTSKQKTNRRGRRITSSTPKPSTDKPKYPTKAVTKTIKKSRDYQAEAKAKAAAAAAAAAAGSKPKSKPSIKEAAYAKDSRNREYDRLRDAGKTKEAEALGRKIAGMKPKEAKENQKRTGGSRIANITLPKKKQSAANKAGYPGNQNY